MPDVYDHHRDIDASGEHINRDVATVGSRRKLADDRDGCCRLEDEDRVLRVALAA
jgi:hypothetical protein